MNEWWEFIVYGAAAGTAAGVSYWITTRLLRR
jgi:hypothetical protein